MAKLFMTVRMAIRPHERENYRRIVGDVVRVAKQAPDGLLGYEWFVSANGHEGTIFEIYESAAHHAKHVQRVVMPHGSALRSIAASDISLYGDVPAPMVAQMRERLGNVPFYGPLCIGVSDARSAPAPGAVPTSKAGVIARFAISGTSTAAALRAVVESSVQELMSRSDFGAFDWFVNESEGHGAVIALSADTSELVRRVAGCLDALRDRSLISEIYVDAPGVDEGAARTRFAGMNVGRAGGRLLDGYV
jgi:quinol monooxygenase YgiN